MNKVTIVLILYILILLIPLIAVTSIALRHDEITPNDEFFTLSISTTPKISSETYQLKVDGLVQNELNLSFENITSLEQVEVTASLKCVEGPSGRAKWTGVRLATILNLATVQSGAREVIFYAADGYSSSLTLEDAFADDVLLAYEMNGETLPADHGYPVRLVVPGKAGYKWVKWITHIELVDYDYKGYWESRGWDDEADLTPLSDWIYHATFLSIGFIFGGLAVLSGYKRSGSSRTLQKLPGFINKNFHKYISILYLGLLFFTFIYWAYTTYSNRGGLFYTIHGLVSAGVIILFIIGGISGLQGFKKNRTSGSVHRIVNVFGFMLYAVVIYAGLLLAIGT
jgi:hypothetical protein